MKVNELPNDDYQRTNRLKQYRAFCHAARLGSITRAAEYLMSSQPAISLQVRSLEEELGVKLFDRRGPRISLTPLGHGLYRLAMPLVEGIDRLSDTFAERYRNEISRVLVVGASQTSAAYLLPTYLQEFRQRYPECRTYVRTGSGEERLKWLRDYELDVIVAAVDVPPRDVEFYPILASNPVLITPLDHPLAGRDSVAVDEVVAYPLVVHPPEHYVTQGMEALMRMRGVAPRFVVEAEGWDVITSYVAAGVGISYVPEICETEDDRLCKIKIRETVPHREYGAIVRRDGLLTGATGRFLEMMFAEFSHRSGDR